MYVTCTKRYALFTTTSRYLTTAQFVPKHKPLLDEDVERLKKFIDDSHSMVILTGAGVSTESGIPDYRSEDVGLYARTNHRPIQYREFLASSAARRRYWARNYIGWTRFSRCRPNETHRYVADLETVHRKASAVVTQNVDGLHGKAGSSNVVELHGSAYRVRCLSCDAAFDRHDVQRLLEAANPDMGDAASMVRPDGDVDVPQSHVDAFNPPSCTNCVDGILKPDIIFFGDNVPRQRVQRVRDCVSTCDSLLVLGSSLAVFSAFRIVLQAVDERKRICIVNIGPTRGDDKADLRIAARCGDILSRACSELFRNDSSR